MKPISSCNPSALAAALAAGVAGWIPSADAEEGGAVQTVVVRAAADASAGGLPEAYPGGQVARGGRVGVLGDQDAMSTPFSLTAYTSELIRDQQARGVGDVLLNDPSVRVARGFGNFQESYFIRGFLLSSDDLAYNGLYGLLPRQYIAAELFERVEVLKGASAFLNGAAPGGDGIGGSVNLLPKRAPSEALTRISAGLSSGSQRLVDVDIARRFGPDGGTGLRWAAMRRDGGTGVDDEGAGTTALTLGLDWRDRNTRLSADIGHQDNRLVRTRTNVALGAAVKAVPDAPDGHGNWAQRWSYSNEQDTFGTFRGEVDLNRAWTAWLAAGARHGQEANSLANVTVQDSAGNATSYRFDNARRDRVATGEAGLRGRFAMGVVSHAIVLSASAFNLERKNAYALSSTAATDLLRTNLYAPSDSAQPALMTSGNDLGNPRTTGRTALQSEALADSLGFMEDAAMVIVGVRRQKIDVRSFEYNTGVPADPYARSRASPVLGLLLRVSPSLSVYANAIQSLAQGETAPSTAANYGQQLAPYVANQKEVGLKFDGGDLGASVALFSTTKPRAFVTDDNVFTAAGADRHRGIEFTIFGLAGAGLRVLGGLTLLDARQRETGVASTENRKVIGVPDEQGTLDAEWDVPGARGLSVDARVVVTGDVFADAANTLAVPGWTRVDIGARYEIKVIGRKVTLRARVDNVAGAKYWSSAGGAATQGYLVLGAPRTFTTAASIDF